MLLPSMCDAHDIHSDWKKLPEIVAHGFGGRTSVVVCTHLSLRSHIWYGTPLTRFLGIRSMALISTSNWRL